MSISELEVVPAAVSVETSDDELTVSLADGRRVSVPLVWYPRLLNATTEERADFRLIGGGEGIHWPQIDEDISVGGLLRGLPTRTSSLPAAPLQSQRANEYRRSEHGDSWHWSRQCSAYPTENYFARAFRPPSGLCNECAVKSDPARR